MKVRMSPGRAGMATKPTVKLETSHGEDYLQSCNTLKLTMENGQQVSFDLRAELAIPASQLALFEAARTAHERYAFWGYQCERALARVRALEIKLSMIEAGYNLSFRKMIREEEAYMVTEGAVRAHVDGQTEVRVARARLNEARRVYGVIRTMKEAMNHRCFALSHMIERVKEIESE